MQTETGTRKSGSKQKFDGARGTYFKVDPNYVLVIGVDTHHKSLDEHCLYQEPEELSEEWIENLMEKGIIEPVIVRKEGEDAVVVAGRRRTIGLREANKRLIASGKKSHELPILAEEGDDADALERMIIENMARREPNPMQKAALLKAWWNRPENEGKGDKEASVIFCVTPTTIRNWKKMWDLDPKVQKAVMQGEISPNAAADLSDLEPAEQREKFSQLKKEAEKIAEKTGGGTRKITTRNTETERRQRKGSVAAVAYTPPKATVLRKVAEDEAAMKKLPSLVQSVLRYVVGLSDGSDLPDLLALVVETPGRGKRKTSDFKPTRAQKELLDLINEAKGELLASQAKKGAKDSLIKAGLVEQFTGDDGLSYLRKTAAGEAVGEEDSEESAAPAEASSAAPAETSGEEGTPADSSSSNGSGHEDPAEVEIPSIASLEEMSSKELNRVFSALQISTDRLSGLKGKDLQVKKVELILEEKRRREAAGKDPAKPSKSKKGRAATPVAEA